MGLLEELTLTNDNEIGLEQVHGLRKTKGLREKDSKAGVPQVTH